MAPTVVTFGLSPSYGIHTARDAHDWFIGLVRERDELEVETDRVGEARNHRRSLRAVERQDRLRPRPTYAPITPEIHRKRTSQ